MELKFDADASLKKQYSTFIRQLSGWSGSGTVPELAGLDLSRALELQRQHWQSLGLKVDYKFKRAKNHSSDIPSFSYNDRVFVNTFIGDNRQLVTNISSGGRTLYDRTDDVGVTVVVQELRKGVQPSPDMPVCCPHCGAPSKFMRLLNGCPYCDTHVLMDDLYPRVTNCFLDNHSDNKNRNLWEIPVFIAAGIAMIYFILTVVFEQSLTDGSVAPSAVVVSGIFLGFVMMGIRKVCSVIGKMGKDLRGTGKVGRSLFFRHKIKKIDPEFSSEYFRDRAMHLLRMMAYSKDPSVYTACECQRPKSWQTVLDASLHNFGIDRYRIRGNECTVTLTLYTDCLIYHKGKIRPKAKKFRMTLRKVITAPTDLGFSVRAVSCPSCGASFDAEQVRNCPFCGHEYDLARHDWVLTDIR